MTLRKEALAFVRCWYVHPGNNTPQKVALYALTALYVAGAAGILFGAVTLDSADKLAVWSFLGTSMGVLLGRTWKKEVVLIEKDGRG